MLHVHCHVLHVYSLGGSILSLAWVPFAGMHGIKGSILYRVLSGVNCFSMDLHDKTTLVLRSLERPSNYIYYYVCVRSRYHL